MGKRRKRQGGGRLGDDDLVEGSFARKPYSPSEPGLGYTMGDVDPVAQLERGTAPRIERGVLPEDMAFRAVRGLRPSYRRLLGG